MYIFVNNFKTFDTIETGSDTMKFNIIKKKASSLRELGHETIQLENIHTLYDIIFAFTNYELNKKQNLQPYQEEEVMQKAKLGKIQFASYNENKDSIEKAMNTAIQDFKDGIYRVYINGEECTNLDSPLSLNEENDIVFIKLVMLAGRLW